MHEQKAMEGMQGNMKKRLSLSSVTEQDDVQPDNEAPIAMSILKKYTAETKFNPRRRLSLPNAMDPEQLRLRGTLMSIPPDTINGLVNHVNRQKRMSLPGVEEADEQELRLRLSKNLGKRRISIAVGESFSELKKLHLAQQPAAPPRSKQRRGSDLSIGSQRRMSRVSVDCPNAAPDGGYGWVIVAAAFVVMCVGPGFTLAFGMYYVEFLRAFNESKSKTSWIGSLLSGMLFASAPLGSACAKRFGVRVVGFGGCLMSFVALIASTFSTNVTSLIITFGLFGGIGIGLAQTAAFIPVAFYFDKRQSLALGITTCGAGVGFMCYPPLTEWLIAMYGWKGSLLISAGLWLNALVCFALMRPLEKKPTGNSLRAEILQAMQMRLQLDKISNDDEDSQDEKSSTDSGGSFESTVFDDNEQRLPNRTKKDSNGSDSEQPENLRNGVEISETSTVCKTSGQTKDVSSKNNIAHGIKDKSNQLCHNINEEESQPDNSIGNFKQETKYTDIDKMSNEAHLEKVTKMARRKSNAEHINMCWQHVLDSIDLTFLCNPVYMFYVIIYSLTSAGTYTAYLYITDFGLYIGLSETYATLLLSILGLTSSLARIIVGRLGDSPKIDPFAVYGSSVILCGIVTVICPFIKLQAFYFCFAAILGSVTGIYAVLTPVLAVDLVGVDQMGTGMSLALLIAGMVILVMVPFGGWLYDVTQSYTATYAFSGAAFMVSGVMALVLRCFARCVNKDKEIA